MSNFLSSNEVTFDLNRSIVMSVVYTSDMVQNKFGFFEKNFSMTMKKIFKPFLLSERQDL